jgi:surface antigen
MSRNRTAHARFILRLYSGGAGMRLRRTLLPALTAAVLGISLGGCSYRLGSMAGLGENTASIPATSARASVEGPPEADLAYAKAAAVELMRRGTKDTSQPWENPRTGARGTVTPIATAYAQEGATCRDFLASYLRERRESWYQGGACKKDGKWEVREIRPLQRT